MKFADSSAIHKLIETANVLIVGLDAEGRIEVFNEAAEKITGYDRTEVKGRSWFEAIVPKDRYPEVWRVFDKWRTGDCFENQVNENPILTKSGTERYISWQNNRIDRMGEFCGTISFGIDITERIRAERALRESEYKYREILESASEAIVIVGHDGRIVFFNRKAEEIFGYGREEVLGENLGVLVPEESRVGHADRLHRFFDSPHVRPAAERSVEIAGRHKSGREFPVEIGLSFIDIGGERLAVSFITDITQRRSLEAQLRQAQKMEAVGTLAGGVAHDFNNLLTAINGYSEIVLSCLHPEDPLRDTVGEIKKAGERAAVLTRQLLAFSRKQVLKPVVMDLNTVVHDLDRMLRRLIGEDIELITKTAEDLGHIKADPGQIQQVIMNLAVNARDAMPQGGRLVIETKNVAMEEDAARKLPGIQPGRYVMVSLTDSGCGMSAETLAHIFEPFFTTKEVGKGTGLGLSTAYGIVKQSGGYIYATSKVGKGSTFRVFMPREA